MQKKRIMIMGTSSGAGKVHLQQHYAEFLKMMAIQFLLLNPKIWL